MDDERAFFFIGWKIPANSPFARPDFARQQR